MIEAMHLERAEHLIKVLFETGEWPDAALERLQIDSLAFKNFVSHQVGTLRAMYKDIDARHEAAIATMLTHMFFCGVAAGSGEGYSTDSGLNT